MGSSVRLTICLSVIPSHLHVFKVWVVIGLLVHRRVDHNSLTSHARRAESKFMTFQIWILLPTMASVFQIHMSINKFWIDPTMFNIAH